MNWCVLRQVYFVFVCLDDGGHPLWLHHDLQAAQWILCPAAPKQKLWAGRADEGKWMWQSELRWHGKYKEMIERQWNNKHSCACLISGLGSGRLVLPWALLWLARQILAPAWMVKTRRWLFVSVSIIRFHNYWFWFDSFFIPFGQATSGLWFQSSGEDEKWAF